MTEVEVTLYPSQADADLPEMPPSDHGAAELARFWQPIETAPTDGRAFLAAAPGRDGAYIAWRFDLDNAHGSTHCWYGVDQSCADDGAAEIRPTHWMPLPDQPA